MYELACKRESGVPASNHNEPFLIKNLHEYIEYAHKKGFIDHEPFINISKSPQDKRIQILSLIES